MIRISIEQVDLEPIPTYTYPFPQAVPIHILHLANEGMAHIEFEDGVMIEEDINELVS